MSTETPQAPFSLYERKGIVPESATTFGLGPGAGHGSWC